MIGSSAQMITAQELKKLSPLSRLELSSSFCGNGRWYPKRAIHPEVNVWATVSAVISGIGNAFGLRVKQSMQVSR